MAGCIFLWSVKKRNVMASLEAESFPKKYHFLLLDVFYHFSSVKGRSSTGNFSHNLSELLEKEKRVYKLHSDQINFFPNWVVR